jgi:hypothetical protein
MTTGTRMLITDYNTTHKISTHRYETRLAWNGEDLHARCLGRSTQQQRPTNRPWSHLQKISTTETPAEHKSPPLLQSPPALSPWVEGRRTNRQGSVHPWTRRDVVQETATWGSILQAFSQRRACICSNSLDRDSREEKGKLGGSYRTRRCRGVERGRKAPPAQQPYQLQQKPTDPAKQGTHQLRPTPDGASREGTMP